MAVADKDYITAAMELGCMACKQRNAVDPHHPRGHTFGTGTSLKAKDIMVIPLCFECHREYHDHGRTDWEAKYGTQHELVAEVHALLGYSSS